LFLDAKARVDVLHALKLNALQKVKQHKERRLAAPVAPERL